MTDEEDAAWPPQMYPFTGDWTTYVEVIYGSYLDQFVRSPSHWRGKRIGVRYEPATAGKGYTFWHITCGLDGDGNINEPDLERCARIGWVKAVIEADPAKVLTWEQKRDRDTNVAIAVPDFSFIVFLAERRDRMHLLTAYCVMRQRQRDRYHREYERSKKR